MQLLSKRLVGCFQAVAVMLTEPDKLNYTVIKLVRNFKQVLENM